VVRSRNDKCSDVWNNNNSIDSYWRVEMKKHIIRAIEKVYCDENIDGKGYILRARYLSETPQFEIDRLNKEGYT